MAAPGYPVPLTLPSGPPEAYTTYQVVLPRTHQRPATCVEVGCEQMEHGWVNEIDTTTDLGRQQVGWIRESGRRFVVGHFFHDPVTGEQRFAAGPPPPGSKTVYAFEPGQTCFQEHLVPAGDQLFVVRDGDFRRSTLARRHSRPEDWVEDCMEATDRFNTRKRKG